MEPSQLLKVSDVAERLNVSIWLVYRLLDAKRLGSYRIGGSIRISEEQLRQYLDGAQRDLSKGERRTPKRQLRHIIL